MNTIFQLALNETRVCRKNTSRAVSKVLASYPILLIWLPLAAQTSQPVWTLQETREVTEASGPVSTVVSSDGEIYLAGGSNWYDWPAPINSIGNPSQLSVIVAKLDLSGRPVYATAIGGAFLQDLTLDGAGGLYVHGLADARAFATTPGAYHSTVTSPSGNGYVCKLRAADGVILFCALFDTGSLTPFTLDTSGNIYFAGNPGTLGPTPGAYSSGNRTIAVTKVDAAASTILWRAEFSGTRLGDSASSLTVDSQGNLWIAGTTYSNDFPITPDALISKFPATTSPFINYSTGFLAKLNPSGTSLLYASYTGPVETLTSMSMDGLGNLYTLTLQGEISIVRKFNSTGRALVYERILSGMDRFGLQVQVDNLGVVTALGSTQNVNFATYRSAENCSLTEFPPGLSDGVLVRIGSDGVLLESTFLGLQEPLSVFLQPVAFSLQAAKLYAVVWTDANQVPLSNTSGPHHLELLQLGPDANAGDGLKLACVGSAATATGAPLVRGEIVSLFGNSLSSKTPTVGQPGADHRFPTALGGTQVTFDGVPAPLLYVSDTQVNAIVPWDLSGSVSPAGTKVCVSSQTGKTNCILAGTTLAAPGIFQLASGYAAVVNQDGTINSSDNPAYAGSTVYIYATGLGPVSPVPADGNIVQLPVPTASSPVEASFLGGLAQLSVQAIHAGLAPLQVAGLFQIDVKIPSIPPGIGRWNVSIIVDVPGGDRVASPSLPISLAPLPFPK